eukprot:c27910_g1_i2 orf=519-1244(-)
MVLWVFGYSSLIWKAGFDFDQRIVGFIKGYRRTFHLACIDHRGTPEFPARAATLEPEEGSICWGVAYCVKRDDAAKKVMAYLEVRECEYDMKAPVDFFTSQSPDTPVVSNVVIFLTSQDKSNKYYLGPAPLKEMASQIARAKGPNGPNYEYLFSLEEALRQIDHEDSEITELADEVRRVLGGLNGLKVQTQRTFDGLSQKLFIGSLNDFSHGSLNGRLNLAQLNCLSPIQCIHTLVKSQAM